MCIRDRDWLVMELSSYQIEAAPAVAPKIGIWTTLTPDHLERHGSLEAYRAIKRGLLERSECASSMPMIQTCAGSAAAGTAAPG